MVDFIRDDKDEPRTYVPGDGPLWRLIAHAVGAWAVFILLLRYTWPGGSFPPGFWGWLLRFWWVVVAGNAIFVPLEVWDKVRGRRKRTDGEDSPG